MGIKKALDTNYGVKAEYHRIVSFTVDFHNKVVQVNVASYVSQEARNDKKDALGTMGAQIHGEDFNFANNEPTREAIYGKLMALEQFKGGEAC